MAKRYVGEAFVEMASGQRNPPEAWPNNSLTAPQPPDHEYPNSHSDPAPPLLKDLPWLPWPTDHNNPLNLTNKPLPNQTLTPSWVSTPSLPKT